MDPGQDTQNYPPDEGSYDSLFMDLDAVYQARRSGRKLVSPKPPGPTLVFTKESSHVHSDGHTAIKPNLQKSKSDVLFAQSQDKRPSGVRSNYDEDIYTTTIDRSSPQYAERAARAKKLAQEIEHGSALDVNVDQDVVGDPVKNTTSNHETSVPSDTEETYVAGYRDAPNAYRSDRSAEAPYQHEIGRSACQKCGKVFYQIRKLRQHETIHEKDKCRFCAKSFEGFIERRRHEKSQHELYRPRRENQKKEDRSYDTQSSTSPSGPATSPVSSAARLQGDTEPIRSGINAKIIHGHQQSSAITPSEWIEEIRYDAQMRIMSSPSHSSPHEVRKALGSKSKMGYESVDDNNSPLSPASLIESAKFRPEAEEYAVDDIPGTQDRDLSNDREEIESRRTHPYSEQRSYKSFHVSEDESKSAEMAAPLLVGDTPDLAVGTFQREMESQANGADEKPRKLLPDLGIGDTSSSIINLPSSDRTSGLNEVSWQDDTPSFVVNTISHPLTEINNLIEAWMIVKTLSFFNAISRGFNQAVYPAKFAATILGLRESPIPPNSRRIRWTCTCGMSLYDDFIELVPGGLDDLQRKLDTGDSRRQHTNSNQGSPNHSSSGLGGLLSILGRIPLIRKHVNGKTTGASQLPTHNSSSMTASVTGTARSLCLLLCMQSGIFGTDLHHGQLQDVNCDRDLLTLLRTAYNERRSKLRNAISFRIVNSISFIKFVADMNSNVDIHPHSVYCGKTDCICLPPKCKVEPEPNSEYSCNPIPSRHIPPVGENYLMHLFSSPECIHPSQVWILNQIPKRTRGQLIARPDAPAEGWGLHFQEGWYWMKIMTVILTLFVGGSLVFGLIYAVLRKDVQTAFTVATYWFTASGVVLGYLAAGSP